MRRLIGQGSRYAFHFHITHTEPLFITIIAWNALSFTTVLLKPKIATRSRYFRRRSLKNNHKLSSSNSCSSSNLSPKYDNQLRTDSLESILVLESIWSFMLMMINRAIDFSKASSGLILTASLETINMNEVIRWVEKCTNSPHLTVSMIFDPLPEGMCECDHR